MQLLVLFNPETKNSSSRIKEILYILFINTEENNILQSNFKTDPIFIQKRIGIEQELNTTIENLDGTIDERNFILRKMGITWQEIKNHFREENKWWLKYL